MCGPTRTATYLPNAHATTIHFVFYARPHVGHSIATTCTRVHCCLGTDISLSDLAHTLSSAHVIISTGCLLATLPSMLTQSASTVPPNSDLSPSYPLPVAKAYFTHCLLVPAYPSLHSTLSGFFLELIYILAVIATVRDALNSCLKPNEDRLMDQGPPTLTSRVWSVEQLLGHPDQLN